MREGLNRMYGTGVDEDERDVFYYLTLYNENYPMPARPEGDDLDRQLMAGLYRWAPAPEGASHPATIWFSGSAQGAARSAADALAEHYGVGAELWSATSYKRVREDALDVARWNRLHPGAEARRSFLDEQVAASAGPIVAVSDFMASVPDQLARFMPKDRTFLPLGTEGMGRSDTREALRRHFEVDEGHVVVATLSALAAEGTVSPDAVTDAITRYDIDPDAPNPTFA